MILPEIRIIEAHDVLGLDPLDILVPDGAFATTGNRLFDLEKKM